jgi:peptide/nickel transport system substrate-binding protein
MYRAISAFALERVRQLRWRANIVVRCSLYERTKLTLVQPSTPARVCRHALPVAILVLVAACSPTVPATPAPTKAAGPVRGGVYVDSTAGDGVSLQQLLTSDMPSRYYQQLIWTPLTRIDPKTLEILGVLYEDRPTISSDGAKLTWKLRQGIKWSDGKPITAQDVVFLWQKMMDEKVKFPYRKTYQDSFTDVKALDDSTVEYSLKVPGFCPAIVNSGLNDSGILPKHVYENLDINQNEVNNKPTVTSGYFKFKEWQKDDHFSVSPAYEGFVRGQPLLDGYTYRVVKDQTVATQLFKTQDVDFTVVDPIDWEEMSKLPFAQPVAYYSATGASWVYIGFNLRNPLLADKTLRQAISTAIDKKEMIDKIRLGHAKPTFSFLPSSSWAAADEKDLPHFDFDPAKAKKMLDDAGYKVGADGIRLSKGGKPLKLRLEYNAGNKQREQISLITQQYLKDVGVASEVNAVEWNAYLEKVNTTHDVDMFVLGWQGGYDPSSMKNIWASDGGQNSTGYKNPQVDELFKKAETVPGCKQADRKAVYVELQKLVADDQPYVFLYTQEFLYVYNKRVSLNALTGSGVTYDIEKLSINPKSTQ